MNDLCCYRIQIAGRANERELNAMSPLEMELDRAEDDSTRLSVQTDQAGLIGLVRHLHATGFVLISIDRVG